MKWHYRNWLFISLLIIIIAASWGIYDFNFRNRVLLDVSSDNKVSAWKLKTKCITITSQTLAVINDGDLIQPKISPDGKTLAYSKVLVEKGKDNFDREYTDVRLYDIAAQQKTVLLDSEALRQYAFYSPRVTDIKWIVDSQLEVVISDGNIGAKTLKFDLQTSQAVKTDFNEDNSLDYELTPEKQRIYDEASLLFPAFDKDVLRSAVEYSSSILPGWGIVLQKRYLGHDHHVWFLDFTNKKLTKLVDLPDEKSRFIGGFAFGRSILFLVADNSRAKFYLYQNGQATQIAKARVNQRNLSLEVKLRQKGIVFFLVSVYDTYEKGNNPLYIFNGKELLQVNDYPELSDVDFDSKGQKAAFCFWEHGERHLAVKELKKKI